MLPKKCAWNFEAFFGRFLSDKLLKGLIFAKIAIFPYFFCLLPLTNLIIYWFNHILLNKFSPKDTHIKGSMLQFGVPQSSTFQIAIEWSKIFRIRKWTAYVHRELSEVSFSHLKCSNIFTTAWENVMSCFCPNAPRRSVFTLIRWQIGRKS